MNEKIAPENWNGAKKKFKLPESDEAEEDEDSRVEEIMKDCRKFSLDSRQEWDEWTEQ